MLLLIIDLIFPHRLGNSSIIKLSTVTILSRICSTVKSIHPTFMQTAPAWGKSRSKKGRERKEEGEGCDDQREG